MKVVKKIFLGLIIVLLFFYYILQAMNYTMFERQTLKWSYEKEGYELYIYEKGQPIFFGPSRVRIILTKEDEVIEDIEREISNDGKMLYDSNVEVKFLKDRVEVTLKGEEQGDDKIEIKYKDLGSKYSQVFFDKIELL